MSIYFFGDTHGSVDIDKIFIPNYKYDDYVIVCGDFGVLWSDLDGRYKQEKALIVEKNLADKITKLPCTLLFIDGNHENFYRLDSLKQVEKFGGIAGEYIKDKCYHLKRGEVYNIAGKNIFTMGGALSIDRHYRKEYFSWWSGESIKEHQIHNSIANIDRFQGKLDFVVTHTCPTCFLPKLSKLMAIDHKIADENPYKLQKILNYLLEVGKEPKYWVFGHWHQDFRFRVGNIKAYTIYHSMLKTTQNNGLEMINNYETIRYIKNSKSPKEKQELRKIRKGRDI